MIIAISGSQGQGKSTVLKKLEEDGYDVLPNKTSRTILSEWGLTLNEVNKYAPLTKKFQEEILKRHFDYIKGFIASKNICFVERSFADIFTYCMFQLGSFNEYSDWINDYYLRCQSAQAAYGAVIYLSGRTYIPESDGVRSINPHFTIAVDNLIKLHLNSFECPTTKLIEISEPSLEKRIELIKNIVNTV